MVYNNWHRKKVWLAHVTRWTLTCSLNWKLKLTKRKPETLKELVLKNFDSPINYYSMWIGYILIILYALQPADMGLAILCKVSTKHCLYKAYAYR